MLNPQWTVRGMTVVLVAAVLPAVVTPTVASAAGPSVPTTQVRSVTITRQVGSTRPDDPATVNAMHGNHDPRTDLDGAGSDKATSLSPSATWDVSQQTGDFTWSYPLRVPPAPGGLEPALAL